MKGRSFVLPSFGPSSFHPSFLSSLNSCLSAFLPSCLSSTQPIHECGGQPVLVPRLVAVRLVADEAHVDLAARGEPARDRVVDAGAGLLLLATLDRKSTRLNSS